MPPESWRGQQIAASDADIEAANGAVQRLVLGCHIDDRPARETVERGEGEVRAQLLFQKQALSLAILAEIGDAGLHGRACVGKADGFAVQRERAAAGAKADQAFEQLRAARSDQAAEAKDFAAPQLERYALDIARHADVFRLKHDLAAAGASGGKELGHIAPDHQPGHIHRLQIGRFRRRDMAPVAQHRDAVRDGLHLGEPVRNIQHRDARAAQPPDDGEQGFGFDRGQHGGRLVEDHHLIGNKQRPADLHELAVGERQAAYLGIGRHRRAQFVQHLARAPVHRGVIHHEPMPDFAAQKQVLRDRQVFGEQDLLMDQDDALLLRLDGAGEDERLAVPQKLAFGRLKMPRENAHQGGFAGAVFADDRMDPAGFQRDRHAIQYLDGAEGSGDLICLQHRQCPNISAGAETPACGTGRENAAFGRLGADQPVMGVTGMGFLRYFCLAPEMFPGASM